MTVVVGYIPTPIGRAALDAARTEAERRSRPLIVVNVVRTGDAADPRHADESQLEDVRSRMRGARVRVDVRTVEVEHDIADALLDVVEEEDAGLLVIGIRRHREVARHLIGATSQKLLLDAPCDVLVI